MRNGKQLFQSTRTSLSYAQTEAQRAASGILLIRSKDRNVMKQRTLASGICVAGLLAIGACATEQEQEPEIKWLPNCEGRPFSGLDPEVVARTQCGVVTVPLDHTNPTQGTLKLDITRVTSLHPQRHEGAIFTNPGGPGADSSGFAVVLASIWKGYADEPEGESYRHLINAYDLIGITPRGMGSSPDSQLICQSNDVIVAQNDITQDRSPANLEALRHNTEVLAQGCANQPLAPYITTDQTARDMEFVRIQLNERTLNYFGNSYGTWLGAWYAGLFPKTVGRMVLDSNLDWTSTFQNASLNLAPEKERIFARFVAEPAAENPLVYEMGNDPKGIRHSFINLLPQVQVALRSDTERYSSIEFLMAARVLSTWLRESPTLNDTELLNKAQTYRFSPDTEVNHSALSAFTRLVTVIREPVLWNDIAVGPLKLDPAASVRSTILCNDSATADEKFWTEMENLYATQYPVGGSYFYARHCATWSGKPLSGVPLKALGQASSILMIQAEFDDQTPAPGALKASQSVPNTHMVLLKGAYQHGVSFSNPNTCVNRYTGDYLAYGRKPARLSICFASN